MRLLKYELWKIWGRPVILIYIVALLFTNLLFLNLTQGNSNNKAPTSAYKSLSADLNGLTLTQQKNLVAEKLTQAAALQAIDYMQQVGRTRFSPQDLALINKYGEIYRTGTYKLYNRNYGEEYLFLSQINSELSDTLSYHDYLADIQSKSDEISSFSVFSKGKDNFVLESNKKISEKYHIINPDKVEISFYPQQGLMTALQFFMSDFIMELQNSAI